MSNCRRASEVEALGYDWIPQEIADRYNIVCPEEFVMIARNNMIYSFTLDDSVPEKEKKRLSDLADAAISTLVINGFIRQEILFASTPEVYFAEEYLEQLDLKIEEIEALMPYLCDNKTYERYEFCFERREAILGYLSHVLDEKEYALVNKDIMFMNDELCDSELLARAKTKFIEKKEEILPNLIRIYAKF